MTLTEIKQTIKSPEYDFLRKDDRLRDNIILLGLGGSHAYGTNKEGSDLDIRGIALNSRKEILLSRDFEQVTDSVTDTVIYSLKKIIGLLLSCNPNTIELLGLKPEQYLRISPEGQMLLDNKEAFLSKKAVNSFGGYANQQLYRLNQLAKNQMDNDKLEQHILKTLESIKTEFGNIYSPFPDDFMNLYIDKASERNSEVMDTEIFMDVNLSHYPLRDYLKMWNTLQLTASSYNKVGKRNQKALEHGKIGKHMMHLVRLYHMCFDILERGEINTFRDKDHDFLMEIRNGRYITEDNQVKPEFFDIIDKYEKRLEKDRETTLLPDEPDFKKVEEMVCAINENIVLAPYEIGAAERGMEL